LTSGALLAKYASKHGFAGNGCHVARVGSFSPAVWERDQMPNWNRRRVLASLGILGGSALLTGCGRRNPGVTSELAANEIGLAATEGERVARVKHDLPATPGQQEPPELPVASWTYQPLDPAETAQVAYDMYPQGSCTYAVFGSVITQLADRHGGPFRWFPLSMMRYGASGIGGWGSVCGVVNGAAALIGLFHDSQKDPRRDALITDLCLWYESSMLPNFQPAEPGAVQEIGMCETGSILCHVSVSQWCRTNGCDAFSPERRERCRRLSANGAGKVVELLNGEANGSPPDFLDFRADTADCIDCHGQKSMRDSLGKMSCVNCHQMDSNHP
jgi:hypothetical protein